MSSWFSSFDTTSTLSKLSELSEQVGQQVSSKVQTVKSTVEQNIPPSVTKAVDSDLIRNLTLRSDELTKVHTEIEAEERRKELVKDYLAELLPWETRDEAKVILIDETKQVILSISSIESTFSHPFTPPPGIQLFPSIDITASTSQEEKDGGDDDDTEKTDGADTTPAEGEEPTTTTTTNTTSTNEEEYAMAAQQKLTTLQPLPPLLEKFDLDSHVGLIERLLTVDSELVKMHSLLIGAGEREIIFWKNYFFHCAYARYENGLSIDEIWASKPEPVSTEEIKQATTAAKEARRIGGKAKNTNEEEMTFENNDTTTTGTGTGTTGGGVATPKTSSPISIRNSPTAATTTTSTAVDNTTTTTTATTATGMAASIISTTGGTSASELSGTSGSTTTSYEMVSNSIGNGLSDHVDHVVGTAGTTQGFDEDHIEDDDAFGDDLDDLEAEIARELED